MGVGKEVPLGTHVDITFLLSLGLRSSFHRPLKGASHKHRKVLSLHKAAVLLSAIADPVWPALIHLSSILSWLSPPSRAPSLAPVRKTRLA